MSQVHGIANPWTKITYCLGKIGHELSCSICLGVLTEPWSTPCNHLFCKNCISRSTQFSLQCPLCKAHITKRACNADMDTALLIADYLKLKEAYELDTGTSILSGQASIKPLPLRRNDAQGANEHDQLKIEIHDQFSDSSESEPFASQISSGAEEDPPFFSLSTLSKNLAQK